MFLRKSSKLWLLASLAGLGACFDLAVAGPPLSEAQAELATVRSLPPSLERDVREARLLFFLGKWASDREQALAYFELGRELGKKGMDAKPLDSGSVFWWGGNAGMVARVRHNAGSLKILRELEKALLSLRERDPDYGYAGADRSLGVIYHEAPGFISIGSDRRARECLERAVARHPDFPGNTLGLARFLVDKGEYAAARRLALQVQASRSFQENRFGDLAWEKSDWEVWLADVLKETGEKVK